ncbi:MAG: hypothetical protein CR975_04460 [Gammaproteobacteria bacterium]|nr:MAG: hypothetical protein CR975_04460 [Gammaproteobacteria bacterium]
MKWIPTKKTLWLLAVLLLWFFLFNTLSFFTGYALGLPLLAGALAVAALLLFDILTSFARQDGLPVGVQRNIPHYFIINAWESIELTVHNRSDKKLALSLFDHLPGTFHLSDNPPMLPINLTLSANEQADIRYRIKPQQRGQHTFAGVQLRLSSRLGLWQKNVFLTLPATVKVYPDFRRLEQQELQSEQSHAQGNLSHQRQRGTGTDFDQLREYRMGDALNRIDHKATARLNKLISKEYQIERDQQVVILLDCSRRLRVFQDGLSHFDYALNTTVFLARTVLNQGDAVGLMNFGNADNRFVPPKKGRHRVNKILNSIYDLHTSHAAPDYIKAAKQLMVRQKRRCLVILLTSLQDEDSDAIKTMLRILQRRHLVLIANLKPEILNQPVDVHSLEDAIFYASRETYNNYRDKMLQHIREQKLILLDTPPQGLTTRLLNMYINIKQAGIF